MQLFLNSFHYISKPFKTQEMQSLISPFAFAFCLLFSLSLFGQQETLVNLPAEQTIERYTFDIQTNQTYAQTDYAGFEMLNPQLLDVLTDRTITDIAYYYSDFPKDIDYTKLHNKRLQALAELLSTSTQTLVDHNLKLFRQTACQTKEEAKRMFHGFVITYNAPLKEAVDEVVFEDNVAKEEEEEFIEKTPQPETPQQKSNDLVKVEKVKSEEDLVKKLEGSGVEISNFNVDDGSSFIKAYGYFTEEEKDITGLSNGLIMTTGSIENAVGPNNWGRESTARSSTIVEDEDLLSLIPEGKKLYDACIIEFDIKAESDEMSFRYVFASEEYPEYLTYHDIFGFFISGKGLKKAKEVKLTKKDWAACKKETDLPNKVIKVVEPFADGKSMKKTKIKKAMSESLGYSKYQKYYKLIEPYFIGVKNIAQLPNSSTQVSVSTINHQKNSSFYVKNDGITNKKLYEAWQFDGFSTVLTAKVDVTPGETYHLKLAIADQGDASYDSAVFIEGTGISSAVLDKE